MKPLPLSRSSDRWRQCGKHMIRAREISGRWTALIFQNRGDPLPVGWPESEGMGIIARCSMLHIARRSVLGDYATADEAFGAAEMMLAMMDEPKQCDGADIDRVRRELAKKVEA